ncbi:MAG: cell division ATP-binding protein FtsE [Clostridiales bacterium]|nr:cell division ATP-binding protein FtsE [Clostridiales bacterium]
MVEFSGVSKTYNKTFDALKNVDLSIADGEFVFVVGASGAGKSTFLKLIMREEVPTSGTVTINGYNLNKMRKRDIPYFRRTMGIVFQDFRLIPDMRVYDNVAFALRVTGTKEREVRKRVTHALGMVGLLSKTQSLPRELSGGEQQRVAIARALVNNADLIIADEPTGNIDPAMSIEIMDLLNHINKSNGTTIVMVTHAHDIVRQYDHRIVLLKEGEIVADGYDKDAILALASPDTTAVDAGFYNAPNEYADVEKFIFTYGQGDVPIEETIPSAEPNDAKADQAKEDTPSEEPSDTVLSSDNTDGSASAEQGENSDGGMETDETVQTSSDKPSSPYSLKDDEDINSILKAFAKSTLQKPKKTSKSENTEAADTLPSGETSDGGDQQ